MDSPDKSKRQKIKIRTYDDVPLDKCLILKVLDKRKNKHTKIQFFEFVSCREIMKDGLLIFKLIKFVEFDEWKGNGD